MALLALAEPTTSLAAGPAPDPGGSETTPVTLPPTDGRYFGFSMGALDPVNAAHPPGDYADLSLRAGANMIRTSLSWRDVEPTKGVWDQAGWATYQSIYDSLVSRGITPYFTLGYAPKWARDQDSSGNPICTQRCPPSDLMLPSWQRFVEEAARRFPAAVFGVWNEPNLASSWGAGSLPVDPARFERLAAATHSAVQVVNPDQLVVAGGLATRVVTQPSPDLGYYTFLDRAYDAGLGGVGGVGSNADGIDFHLYPSDQNLGAGSRFARIFADIRSIQAAHGDSSTPLWVTEFGRTTSGDGAVDEAGQADLLLRGVRRMLTMPDVKTVLVFRLDENPDYAPNDPEFGLGVMHPDSGPYLPPKPAFCTFVAEAVSRYPLCPDSPPAPVQIDSGPRGVQSSTDATFSFSTSEVWASLQCSFDSEPFAPCSSPLSFSGLDDGTHRFRVEAVDNFGNIPPDPVQRTFTVDTTAPETTIDSGPSGPTANDSPSFSFSASEPGSTFQCSLDDSGWQACSSGDGFGPLADGDHSIAVRGIDAVGNTDASPATRAFTVDTTAPETTIDSGPSGPTANDSPSFSFSSESGAGFECRLDSGSWVSCGGSKSYSHLADGQHLFEVRAIDGVGNTDATPAGRSFTVDTTGPNTTLVSGTPTPTNNASPSFTFKASEGNATFECRLDSGDWKTCSSPFGYTGLNDGPHRFDVRALDALGNRDQTPDGESFTVDQTPPDTQITAGPTVSGGKAKYSFTSSEGGSTFKCRVDADAWQACTSPFQTSKQPRGRHTFQVRATDKVGNTDQTPAQSSFTA